jgi:putative membrane protein
MAYMVADHKKDVADFQRESSAAHDPAVKTFATQTLPILQDHLKQAQSIAPAQ